MFGIKSCDAFLYRKRPFYNDGFSLIELSIAMIILSLILLPLISLANAQRQTRMIEDTMGFKATLKTRSIRFTSQINDIRARRV